MAESEKKARGPESAKSRILRASERFDGLTPEAKERAREFLTAKDPAARTEQSAKDLEAVASFIRIVAPLDAASVEKLVTLVS